MASSWVKSLHCKSRVYDDVVHSTTNCRSSYQNLKDVVNVGTPKAKRKPPRHDPFYADVRRSHDVKAKSKQKPKLKNVEVHPSLPENRVRRTVFAPITKGSDSVTGRIEFKAPFFPSVVELAVGHPSRNVVEIIFGTRWDPSKEFSGRVEMVFKVQNSGRVLAQFEDYRDLVKLRAGETSEARCMADGNEMMQFQCLSPLMDVQDGAKSICTHSSSGAAHESSGWGKGRRSMVICRVIAGRVSKRADLSHLTVKKDGDSGGYDSVCRETGELFVFDQRAVLPCFIVVYKL